MLTKINYRLPALLIKPKNRFWRHLLIQLMVTLMTINIFWDEPLRILPGRFGVWIAYFLLIDMLIYVNMYLLVPRLLLKGRTGLYLLLAFLLVFGVLFGIGMLQSAVGESDARLNTTPMPAVIGMLSGLAAVILLLLGLTALQLFKYRMENSEKINALENATMKVALSNLQNQINPHFLFNMLNNANILADENADSATHILRKLKTLLQYQVEEGAKESVNLTDDITFIGDYLALEKLRRDRFCYNVEVVGNTDVNLPPLLFIPFVENAVKHNPENDSYVNISFRITDNRLYFECANPKAKLPRKSEPENKPESKPGGIGLVNIKKRLELLFEKNYSLVLKNEKEQYTVKMEIKI